MSGSVVAGGETVLPAGAPALELRGLTVAFGAAQALTDVDLVVQPGEAVAVVGPSGAGKSTLLSCCSGSVRPSSGSVHVLGRDVASLDGRQLRALRRDLGSIHQHLSLVGQLRVVHNVNAGRLGHWTRRRALWSLLRPVEVEAAQRALERVGVAHKLRERTDHLSGGERQRVALARVLVQDAKLVLADEPIAALDPARAREVLGLLTSLAREGRRTLLVSLHAFDLAREHCDRVVGLRAGRVVFDLPAAQVDAALGEELYRIGAEP